MPTVDANGSDKFAPLAMEEEDNEFRDSILDDGIGNVYPDHKSQEKPATEELKEAAKLANGNMTNSIKKKEANQDLTVIWQFKNSVKIKHGTVALWIEFCACNQEMVGSSLGPGKVVDALSLSDCMGIISNHKVTCSGRDKERGKTNSSCIICEVNRDIRAMFGKKSD